MGQKAGTRKNIVVAVVGLIGSGKTEVARILERKGFYYIRFGQITLDELISKGMEISEENERKVREDFRRKYGMAAYAILNLPKFERALEKSNVAGDGLYSFDEYLFLKKHFGRQLIVLAIWASPAVRYKRLEKRIYHPAVDKKAIYRPYSKKVAWERDFSEIRNLDQGGPIAMADYTIVNESTKVNLQEEVERFLTVLGKRKFFVPPKTIT
jgi:dephospho-CoA kinase